MEVCLELFIICLKGINKQVTFTYLPSSPYLYGFHRPSSIGEAMAAQTQNATTNCKQKHNLLSLM